MRTSLLLASISGCLVPPATPPSTSTPSTVGSGATCGGVALPADCDVPATACALAGPDAVDCGVVALHDPLGPAWACAVAAFEAGDAFFLAWEDHGIDTLLVHALAFDGTRAWSLAQDHEDEPPWRIDGWDCLDPVVTEVEDDPYDAVDESGLTEVVCSDRAPDGNHYEVCGACPGCNPPGVAFVWP